MSMKNCALFLVPEPFPAKFRYTVEIRLVRKFTFRRKLFKPNFACEQPNWPRQNFSYTLPLAKSFLFLVRALQVCRFYEVLGEIFLFYIVSLVVTIAAMFCSEPYLQLYHPIFRCCSFSRSLSFCSWKVCFFPSQRIIQSLCVLRSLQSEASSVHIHIFFTIFLLVRLYSFVRRQSNWFTTY